MSDFRRSWYRRKACAAYFCKVPDSREIRAWTCEIWPREQRPPGVFLVRLRAVFRSGFRLDPDKFLAIREFHVVHDVSFFPMCPGSQINLLRVRKTLCASVATSVGKFRKFQHSLISSACFHARGRRSSRCRISTILVSSESLCYLLFQRYRPCTEASLGSQDMILRTEAVGMFLMPRGVVSSIQFLVWSTVRSNLGQTWSTLVKFGQKLSKLLGNVSRTSFQGFLGKADPSRAGKRLGQTSVKLRSTLVKLGQPWSNLVNPGQTLGNVSRTFFLGVFDAESPRRIMTGLGSGLSRFACRHPRKSRG
uniref:Uncharacterized protein n=1 Tax=Fagus sylvatica TaxID=28930 RepID=A0A2N9ERU7_FAGSY